MKNKKILRAIAALTVGAVAAAGCVSMTACSHKHTWKDGYIADGATGHYQECSECGEHSKNKPHEIPDGGTECTLCHWSSATVAVTGVSLNKNELSLKVGGSEKLTAEVAPSNATNKAVTWSVSQGDAVTVATDGTVTAVKAGTATVTVTTTDGSKTDDCVVTVTEDGGEDPKPAQLTHKIFKIEELGAKDAAVANGALGTGLGLELVGDKASKVGETDGGAALTSTYNGEALSLSKYLDTQGGIKGSKSIKVTTTEKTTVYVYAYSGGGTRYLALYDGMTDNNGYDANTNQSIGNGSGTVLGVAKFVIAANTTKYIGSTSGGIRIFAIGVVTGGDVSETTAKTEAADPATCTKAGNIAYTVTNYGRYLNGSSVAIGPDEIVDPQKPHNYEYDQAALDADLPTETDGKSVTVTCHDCSDKQTVNLPNLKSSAYVTKEADGGKVEYTFTDTCGAVVTFTAAAAAKEGVVGTYTYTPNATSGLVGATSDGNVSADSLLTLTDPNTKFTKEASYLQFGDSKCTVELTVYVEAGSTIELKATYFTNDNQKVAGLKATFINEAIADDTGKTDTWDQTTGKGVDVNATSTYTASVSGTIKISISRHGSTGVRTKSITLKVTKAS